MSIKTKLGQHDRPTGNFRYRTLPQILLEEQMAFAARQRARNRYLMKAELQEASLEEREGAALLRQMLERTDIIIEDEEAAVLRIVVPQKVMSELQLWGSDNVDAEPGHDVEGWQYQA